MKTPHITDDDIVHLSTMCSRWFRALFVVVTTLVFASAVLRVAWAMLSRMWFQ